MGLTVVSWADLSTPEAAGLMERWEQQRAVRVPWLAARLADADLTLSFDVCGVTSVGRWCTGWFAAPDGVDDQPPVVWLGSSAGARLPCSEDATVVADAVGGFLESVLWGDHPAARRRYSPRATDGLPDPGANEPGLGHREPLGGETLPWQLMQTIRSVALRGTRGVDLRRDLAREYAAARNRLTVDRDRDRPVRI